MNPTTGVEAVEIYAGVFVTPMTPEAGSRWPVDSHRVLWTAGHTGAVALDGVTRTPFGVDADATAACSVGIATPSTSAPPSRLNEGRVFEFSVALRPRRP